MLAVMLNLQALVKGLSVGESSRYSQLCAPLLHLLGWSWTHHVWYLCRNKTDTVWVCAPPSVTRSSGAMLRFSSLTTVIVMTGQVKIAVPRLISLGTQPECWTLCHSSEGYRAASLRCGSGLISIRVMWDLWCTKWHWDSFPPTALHSSSSITRDWYNRPNTGRCTTWTQFHITPRN
jgi:hypothetical protein